ncbi:MAG: right-handed parallel beta-helix repeat-containing protein [Candidatus Sumerlaeota bacterium]|nr:right-handed parallel beta-helix repeat-containing protein [Candidatus Sumerlaeota bacterium]
MSAFSRILMIGIFALTLANARAADFYVATNGSDAWSGKTPEPNAAKTDGPFATLERARGAIRDQKKSGTLKDAVTVHVRAGVYALPKGLRFEAQDSGTAAAPVIWRGYRNEKPILIGGRVIANFTPYKGEILKADVGAQGFKGVYFRQLIFDGARQHLARYPNFDPQNPYGGGWAYADGKYIPMYQEVPGEDKHSFTYKETDSREWARPDEIEVFVFARYNWWNNICRVKSVDRPARRVTLAQDASYAIRPTDRYYFQNALEELDSPGEWYLDRQTSTLYFWPPAPLAGKSVMAPATRTILELAAGAAHITFRGFIIECAEGTAVTMTNTSDCRVAGCVIRNVGDYGGSGVSINGGARNGVAGCDIHDTGSNAVSLNGGDRIKLVAAENYADNNYMHHVGVYYKQGVGVSLSGCGNRATHNLIHDAPRFGIQFSGNNFLIEYNHIRHVDLETADTGAVYTGGRDWLGSRGTVIRYNYFHDILGYGYENGKWVSPHYAWGVYLDDNTGGVDVIGNIVARTVRGLIHLHNGRDNLVENNVFVDAKMQQIECSGWTKDHKYWANHFPTMVKGYESVMNEPAWRSMRNMNIHPKDAVLPDGKIMSGNVFLHNIVCCRDPKAKYVSVRNFPFDHNQFDSNLVWHYGQPVLTGQKSAGKEIKTLDEWKSWQALGMDRNSIVADPLFVDADKDDYRLKPDSPAFKLGFKPIPVEKIGPYQDELRASWPIIEVEGAREKPLVSEAR